MPDLVRTSDAASLEWAKTPLRVEVLTDSSPIRVRAVRSSEQSARELKASAMLGRYRILEKIGEGGMGCVYKAWDPMLGRKVALKLLSSPGVCERVKARFKREVQSLAVLSHPNVVTLHDFCSDGAVCFAVMEYLDGSTLREVMQKGGGLPAGDCLRVGSKIARGLAAAHEQGIVHRDVKPENVVVTLDGRVKLLDFGLSIRSSPFREKRSPVGGSNTSEQGRLVGTVAYMSPEQARGEELDFRSDVFAFGIVLYEMLTGRHPFAAETLADTLMAIKHDSPARSARRGPLSERVFRIARRCLSKRREDRYQSTSQLARLLSNLHRKSRSAGRDRLRQLSAGSHASVGLRSCTANVRAS